VEEFIQLHDNKLLTDLRYFTEWWK